jgi:hypothetical protein
VSLELTRALFELGWDGDQHIGHQAGPAHRDLIPVDVGNGERGHEARAVR